RCESRIAEWRRRARLARSCITFVVDGSEAHRVGPAEVRCAGRYGDLDDRLRGCVAGRDLAGLLAGLRTGRHGPRNRPAPALRPRRAGREAAIRRVRFRVSTAGFADLRPARARGWTVSERVGVSDSLRG